MWKLCRHEVDTSGGRGDDAVTVQRAEPMSASVLLAPWLDGPVRRLHVAHRSRLALSLADAEGRVAFSVTFPGAVRLPYACAVASPARPAPTPSSLSVGDGVLAWGDDDTSSTHYRVNRWWSPARPGPGSHPRLATALDPDGVRRLAATWRGSLGRGPGLTPYADDVLCGALVALRAAGHPAVAPLAAEISASHLEASTTATSASLLRAACEGWCIDELAAHLLALDRSDDPEPTRRALLGVGSSSGSGLLAGVAHALPGLVGPFPPRREDPVA